MTRLELMKTGTPEEIAHMLCVEHDLWRCDANDRGIGYDVCETCIAQDFCKVGQNGFIDWLLQEAHR